MTKTEMPVGSGGMEFKVAVRTQSDDDLDTMEVCIMAEILHFMNIYLI